MRPVTIIQGRLVRDPESKQAGGSTITRMTVAVDDGSKEKPHTSFFEINAWGKLSELCYQYIKKGQKITAICNPRQEQWEGQNGKQSRVVFVASEIDFGEKPKERFEDMGTEVQSDDIPF